MNVITLTSKGQVTLPAAVRKQLHLKEGDQLNVSVNVEEQTFTVSRPLTLDQLSAKYSKLVKPGTKPVLDADAYYQAHRRPRV